MKKTQIACKASYKYERLENWVSAQMDDYFLKEKYLYFSLSSKKVCQCLETEKPSLFVFCCTSFFSCFPPSLDTACASHITHILFQSSGVLDINIKMLTSQMTCCNKARAAVHMPIKSWLHIGVGENMIKVPFLWQLYGSCPRKLKWGAVLPQMLINF